MSGATSRRRFLRGVAGLSLGSASLGALAACQGRPARPASKRLPLIGYFGTGTERANAKAAALREGLEALGYLDGQTIRLESRYGGADQSRWPDVTSDLVGLHPDVIVMSGLPALPMILSQTRTIPIVVVLPATGVEVLIGGGFIKSQVQPGGTVTGIVGEPPTLWSKRLDLLKETVPGASRVGALQQGTGNASSSLLLASRPAWASNFVPMQVSQPSDLDAAFAMAEQEHTELLAVVSSAGLAAFLDQVAEQTRRHRLPAISDNDAFAASGGLMNYGPDLAALLHGAGRFVDKILRGAKPADLPVELPTAFSFTINKATANALGLTIPPALLAQATEVLQ